MDVGKIDVGQSSRHQPSSFLFLNDPVSLAALDVYEDFRVKISRSLCE